MTFIVVNKMHHTRLFATDNRDMIGKSQNLPAGTVVDTGIVDRNKFDFVMMSSQGIQE